MINSASEPGIQMRGLRLFLDSGFACFARAAGMTDRVTAQQKKSGRRGSRPKGYLGIEPYAELNRPGQLSPGGLGG